MSVSCKFERSLLSHEENEVLRLTHGGAERHGSTNLTASGDALSFQQSRASLLPHAPAALGTKGLGAASRLMVAWLTP